MNGLSLSAIPSTQRDWRVLSILYISNVQVKEDLPFLEDLKLAAFTLLRDNEEAVSEASEASAAAITLSSSERVTGWQWRLLGFHECFHLITSHLNQNIVIPSGLGCDEAWQTEKQIRRSPWEEHFPIDDKAFSIERRPPLTVPERTLYSLVDNDLLILTLPADQKKL